MLTNTNSDQKMSEIKNLCSHLHNESAVEKSRTVWADFWIQPWEQLKLRPGQRLAYFMLRQSNQLILDWMTSCSWFHFENLRFKGWQHANSTPVMEEGKEWETWEWMQRKAKGQPWGETDCINICWIFFPWQHCLSWMPKVNTGLDWKWAHKQVARQKRMSCLIDLTELTDVWLLLESLEELVS